MALNSLKIATGGYLKRGTKAALVIAVSGYLNFAELPPQNQGGGGYYETSQELPREDNKLRILREDSEIVAIVELCLKTTII